MGRAFQPKVTSFNHDRVEDYNWNYLDQHICGHSDFEELGESQKYWRCRYLLLPLESPKFSEGEASATREAQQLIINFVRFMDFLNHIKRTPQSTVKGGQATMLKRHQSLPATHAGFLSPMMGRSAPTPQDPPSNISSPTPSSSLMTSPTLGRSVMSPAPGRSRSRQRKLLEIGEQHGTSSTDLHVEQLKKQKSDQSLRSRTPESVQHGQRQRSHSPRIRSRENGGSGQREDRDRGRRGQKSSKRSSRNKPSSEASQIYDPGANNLPQESHKLICKVQSRSDVFERGYDDDPVDTGTFSPRPPKARRSPLLLRKKSRDDLSVASTDKKEGRELQFGSSKASRDLSLDRMRSPLKRKKNLPVEVTPPTPVGEAPPTAIDSDPVSTSTLSSFDDGISILNTDSPPLLILKGLEDPETGMDFLTNQPGLKAGSFLAMEAVDWVMERVAGAATRQYAVNVLQVLVTERLIIHASGDFKVPFVDGYFIYSMPHREKQDDTQTKENIDRSFLIIDPMDFNTFSKCWFEVGVRHPSKLESPANTSLEPPPRLIHQSSLCQTSIASPPTTWSLKSRQKHSKCPSTWQINMSS